MERYSRQILFKGIGKDGQRRLRQKYAVIAGCGALGSVIANSLTRAGVGHIKIIDRDFIEESNLQRQILFDEEDIRNDLPKAVAAQRRLQNINSEVVIDAAVSDIDQTNVEDLIGGADIVMDGLDNFETRFIINDCCIKNNIPWVYGACVESSGLSMNIIPNMTPCLRCVFESPPPPGVSPTCDTVGIIAPIASAIASIQVIEALKILTENWGYINKKLVRIDLWNGKYDQIHIENLKEIANCLACKAGIYEFLTARPDPSITTLCGRNAVQIKYREANKIDFKDLSKRLNRVGETRHNDFMMKFKADGYELTLFNDGRAIIFGTDDPVKARNLYARYIGM